MNSESAVNKPDALSIGLWSIKLFNTNILTKHFNWPTLNDNNIRKGWTRKNPKYLRNWQFDKYIDRIWSYWILQCNLKKKRRPYTQLGLVYTKTGGAKNVGDKSHRHVEMCVCVWGGDLLPPNLLKNIFFFIWVYIMYVRYKAYLNQTHIPLIYATEMKLKLLKEN